MLKQLSRTFFHTIVDVIKNVALTVNEHLIKPQSVRGVHGFRILILN